MTYNLWDSCLLVPGFSRSGCASWVQAIGSILAICAAAAIAYVQHRQNLQQQRRIAALAWTQAIAAPLAVAERIRTQLQRQFNQVIPPLGTDGDWSFNDDLDQELRNLIAAYKALPLHTLPGYTLIHNAYDMVDWMERAVSQLTEMASLRSNLVTVDRQRREAFVQTMLHIAALCNSLNKQLHHTASIAGETFDFTT